MAKFDYQSLPKKRMGAGCLFFNTQNEVLLVKPGYKPTWEIPGGIVEEDESPQQCCQREVHEELGLNKVIDRLLVLDYNRRDGDKTESLMFVFYGGTLTTQEIEQITLPDDELVGFQFFTQDGLPDALSESLRDRILRAWRQVGQSGTLYRENVS
ncbi:MAG: NUDIX hydrolase [Chloroflexota bacterium]